MPIYRNKKGGLDIDNSGVEDPRLCLSAKGLLFYFLSQDDDYEIRVCELVNQLPDGKIRITSALKQLEDTGYVIRQRTQKISGHLAWTSMIFESMEARTEWELQNNGLSIPKGGVKRLQKVRGWVYLIGAEGLGRFKIGLSTKPPNRTKVLRNQSPIPLHVFAAIASDDIYGLEDRLHDLYAEKRVHGEWFELSSKDIENIKSLKNPSEG